MEPGQIGMTSISEKNNKEIIITKMNCIKSEFKAKLRSKIKEEQMI